MHLTHSLWLLALLLVTLTILTTTTSARHVDPEELQLDIPETSYSYSAVPPHRRSKRAFGDFFAKVWTVGSLGKAQYDDTRTTLAKVYEILRDSFSDTMVKKTVSRNAIILIIREITKASPSSPQLLCNPGPLVMERRRPEK